jgi:hypothetical protein
MDGLTGVAMKWLRGVLRAKLTFHPNLIINFGAKTIIKPIKLFNIRYIISAYSARAVT